MTAPNSFRRLEALHLSLLTAVTDLLGTRSLSTMKEWLEQAKSKRPINPFGSGIPIPLVEAAIESLEQGFLAKNPSEKTLALRFEEKAWVLEKGDVAWPQYLTIENGLFQWTEAGKHEIDKAFRLSRKDDAEALATVVEDAERVACHTWL